ncbi:hypothetical protein [Natronorubrum halophilum]|uniref:hypothetical protein n=1 Tax=Natronorubrum halophilum TaxID=1702106 RepID=UPI001485227B|nr:hypothetical protein [Natronorubrum halophilum]
MSDGNDSSADDSSRPACPNCGEPIVVVTVTGPLEGVAAPCGCRVPPDVATDSRTE